MAEEDTKDEVKDDGKHNIHDDKQTPLTGETLDPHSFEPGAK